MTSTKMCICCEDRMVGFTQVTVYWLTHHVDMEVNSDCADTFAGIMNNQACGKAGMHTSIQSLGLVVRRLFSHLITVLRGHKVSWVPSF